MLPYIAFCECKSRLIAITPALQSSFCNFLFYINDSSIHDNVCHILMKEEFQSVMYRTGFAYRNQSTFESSAGTSQRRSS